MMDIHRHTNWQRTVFKLYLKALCYKEPVTKMHYLFQFLFSASTNKTPKTIKFDIKHYFCTNKVSHKDLLAEHLTYRIIVCSGSLKESEKTDKVEDKRINTGLK